MEKFKELLPRYAMVSVVAILGAYYVGSISYEPFDKIFGVLAYLFLMSPMTTIALIGIYVAESEDSYYLSSLFVIGTFVICVLLAYAHVNAITILISISIIIAYAIIAKMAIGKKLNANLGMFFMNRHELRGTFEQVCKISIVAVPLFFIVDIIF